MIRHLCPSKTFNAPILTCVNVCYLRKIRSTKLLVDKLWHAVKFVVVFSIKTEALLSVIRLAQSNALNSVIDGNDCAL